MHFPKFSQYNCLNYFFKVSGVNSFPKFSIEKHTFSWNLLRFVSALILALILGFSRSSITCVLGSHWDWEPRFVRRILLICLYCIYIGWGVRENYLRHQRVRALKNIKNRCFSLWWYKVNPGSNHRRVLHLRLNLHNGLVDVLEKLYKVTNWGLLIMGTVNTFSLRSICMKKAIKLRNFRTSSSRARHGLDVSGHISPEDSTAMTVTPASLKRRVMSYSAVIFMLVK